MNLAELLSNPSMLHAAVVHMPIAGAIFGLIFIILSAIFHRNNSIRAVTAVLFLIVAVSSYVAIETGEDAKSEVPNTLPAVVWDQISAHEDVAEKVLYAAIFTFAALLISLIRVDSIRIFGLILSAIGAIISFLLVGQAGHFGGTLVYVEGIGTPLLRESSAVTEIPLTPTPDKPMPEPAPAPEEPMPQDTPAPAPNEEPPAADTPPVTDAPPAADTPPVTNAPPADAAMTPPPTVPEPSVSPAPAEAEANLVPIRDFTLEEARAVSYTRDVWPIIDDQCLVCHENPKADGEYDMTSVENMLKGGKKGGPGVIPGKPDESAIIRYIRGEANPRMPEDEPPLPEEMLHTLRMWIAAGAIDDSATPPAEEPVQPEVSDASTVTTGAPATVPPSPAASPEVAESAPAPALAPEAAPAGEIDAVETEATVSTELAGN